MSEIDIWPVKEAPKPFPECPYCPSTPKAVFRWKEPVRLRLAHESNDCPGFGRPIAEVLADFAALETGASS